MSVKKAWAEIRGWLGEHHPSMLKLLRKPANPDDFAKLEKAIGQTLPKDFKESYLIHDGSREDAGILIGLPLMSLAVIKRVWKGWAEIADDEDLQEDLSDAYSSHPEGAVKVVYCNRGWVPFAGDSQHHVAIDFDPGPKGKKGQIINCGRDDEIRHVIANSLTGFLEFVAERFKSGNIVPADGEDPDTPERLAVAGAEHRDLLTGLRGLLGLGEPD